MSARNIAAGNGTLAGSPVTLTGPLGAKAWVVFNDDVAQTYDFTVGGGTIKVKPGECIAVPVERDTASINGTGDYRFVAFDDASAMATFLRQIGVNSAQLLDGSVTTAKLAASAVTNAKIGDDEIAPAKLDGVAAAGSLALQHAFTAELEVADGATADLGTITMPRKCKLVAISGQKTGAAGDAGDALQVRTAAAGGGDIAAVASLQLADEASFHVHGDPTHAIFAAGAVAHFSRVNGGGGAANTECKVIFHFVACD